MPTYEVEGGRELRRTLKQVEDGLEDLKAVHGEVAGIVADAARPLTPFVEGKLRGSVRPGSTQRTAVIRAGFAKVPYAGVQEFGWPRRNIAPNPYLRPAAKQTEPAWTKRYEDRVKQLLAKVRGK